MKKSLQILATAALFAAGSMTASADRYFETSGDPVAADAIQAGVKYALQGGQAELSGTAAYLNGNDFHFSQNLLPTCLYTFEAAGETVNGSPVWYIKDAEGNYVYAPGNANFYGTSQSRAWKVCIKTPNVLDSGYEFSYSDDEGEIHEYSGINAYVQEAKQAGEGFDLSDATFCEADGGVVIVSATADDAEDNCSTYTYMLGLPSGATNGNVSRGTGYNTNVWVVYEVAQQTPLAYLDAVLTELFPDGFEAENYETGVNPGNYGEEALAALAEAYEAANDGNVTDDNAEAIADALRKAYEDFRASFVSFQAGYYIFTSYRDPRGGALYENFDNVDGDTDSDHGNRTKNGLKWCWSSNHNNNANHTFKYDGELEGEDWYKQPGLKYMIWQVIDSPVKNRYYFKNYVTGRYIHVINTNNVQVPSVPESEVTEIDLYTMEPNPEYPGFWTFFNDNNWVCNGEVSGIHAAGDYANTVAWAKSSEGSSWTIRTVTEEDLKMIEELSVQVELNAALEKLVAEAKKLKKDNINTEMALNGTKVDYASDEAVQQWLNMGQPDGLVTGADQIASNASDSQEGKDLGLLVDGDVKTFWHSSWHTGDSPKEIDPESGEEVWALHNLQLDLLKTVDAVTVKMATRNNSFDGMPRSVKVYGSNNGEDWTLINDSIEVNWYLNSKNKGNNDGDGNNSYNGWFTTKLGYSHVRFDVFHTQSNKGSAGMYFNLSEIRAYEGAEAWALVEDPESPYYVADKALRDAVDNTVKVAEEELEDELATQATIDALRKAIDNLKAGIPDPATFKELIDAATRAHESAVVGTTPGYFPQSAIDALQKAIDAANAAYKPAGMTVEEIQSGKAALQAAIDAFQAALIKPAEGYYMIRSKSSEANNEGQIIIANNSSAKVRIDKGGRVKDGDVYVDETNRALRPGAYWYVQAAEGGYTLKNLYTGLYLAPGAKTEKGNPVDYIAQSAEPYVFGLRFANTEGCFNLLVDEEDAYNGNYFYVNAQPQGGVVTWNSAEGRDNSAWEFVAQDMNTAWNDIFEGGMLFNLENGSAPSVVTFAVDVTADPSINTDVCFYSVLGQDEANNVQLKQETETLKAGQAYVVMPVGDEAKTSAFIFPAAETLEEFVPTHTAAEAANGLVPVFEQTKVPVAGGLFNADHSVILLSEGSNTDVVAANTGYFFDVPATSETGDAYIPAEAVILGIGQIVADNKKGDNKIYTLSGLRVNGAKNLPAGLYIINGKKYIVK